MTASEVQVRRATLKDLDGVASLFDAYRVFYKQESDLPSAREFIKNRLKNANSVILLASSRQEAPLGFTQLYPLFSSVRMRSIWLLNDLFVEENARKRGVGHQLMLRAQEWARQSGAAGLELATARENIAASSVYKDLGWQLDTEYHHYSLSV